MYKKGCKNGKGSHHWNLYSSLVRSGSKKILADHTRNLILFAHMQYSISLVEKDLHGDLLSVWNYPNVASSMQNLIERLVTAAGLTNFIYTKVKSEWVYVLTVPVKFGNIVKAASLGLVSSTFNPEKWHTVLKLLLQQYLDNDGEPVKILEAYLALMTQGKFGGFDVNDPALADTRSLLAVGVLKEMWCDFGFDTIILYNAMLLKKRILVVGDSLSNLLTFMRSIPQLVIHRNDWAVLRPFVLDAPLPLADLAQAGIFVAGTLDARLATSKQFTYDVLVSLLEKRVTISLDSTSDLKMCAFHKEVAGQLMDITGADKSGSADTTNDDIIVQLDGFTKKALAQIQSLGAAGIAEIKNPATAQWMQRLAAAEGFNAMA